ncbi:MAG: Beta-glucosidase BoGH3B [Candidatus Marinimicrobia bacterium]|nr:Beta-glucosidase BoGH3B [Candidatus Neomarinimicrobiota bacterium]
MLNRAGNVIRLLVILSIVLATGLQAETIDEKVESLLSRMTLEEKVGQMNQVAIQVVSKTQGTTEQDHELDLDKLRKAIVEYHVGSILNVWDKAHTIEHWHEVITAIQDVAVNETRLGIPVIYGIDAIHGANYTVGATLFPQSINMAATWNRELVRREGEITALEMRASGIPWNFNPVLGLGRHPAWPRFWETYGESEYLASEMGAIYIAAQQGDDPSAPDKVGTCAKHYLGYSFPLSGKDRTPAWIPGRMLRELFVPPFQAAIDAGALTVMVNSSEINGIPVHSSDYYLTELLREEMGFEGMIVSDWNDIKNLHTREKVAPTQKEAVRMAVMAGVDMSMVPLDFSFYAHLLELVKEGSVPESRIDDAVRKILKFNFQVGLDKHPYPNKELVKQFASEESRRVNQQAARESLVLLKNEGILPLSPDKTVCVAGPTANSLSSLNGGWTTTWQGNEESLYPNGKQTILEAVQNKVGKENILYSRGVDFEKEIDIADAVKKAKKADVAIVAIGEPAYCETPGNIDDLTMTQPQLELVEAISAVDIPIVLVLAEGRPRLITSIAEKTAAIVFAGLPGLEGGPAVADLIFGEFNPSGKLPFTYPRYPNDLMTYDYKLSEVSDINAYDPLFPFGHGLSYTEYEYTNLTLNKEVIGKDDELLVQVTVKNIGQRAGKEPVLLYLTDQFASVTPSVHKLRGVTKVPLEPNQSTNVEFRLTATDLSFVGRDNVRIVEPGEFTVHVGPLSQNFTLLAKDTFSLQ